MQIMDGGPQTTSESPAPEYGLGARKVTYAYTSKFLSETVWWVAEITGWKIVGAVGAPSLPLWSGRSQRLLSFDLGHTRQQVVDYRATYLVGKFIDEAGNVEGGA